MKTVAAYLLTGSPSGLSCTSKPRPSGADRTGYQESSSDAVQPSAFEERVKHGTLRQAPKANDEEASTLVCNVTAPPAVGRGWSCEDWHVQMPAVLHSRVRCRSWTGLAWRQARSSGTDSERSAAVSIVGRCGTRHRYVGVITLTASVHVSVTVLESARRNR